MKNRIIRVMSRPLVMVAVLLLSACGSGLEGTYSGTGNIMFGEVSINATFDSDTVSVQSNVSMMGQTVNQPEMEYEYEVEDNRIKIKAAEGVAQVWTLEDDGTITVPMPPGDIKLIKLDEV